MSQKFMVTIAPDGSAVITWAAPSVEDPEGREAAVLDRDALGSKALVTILTEAKEGAR